MWVGLFGPQIFGGRVFVRGDAAAFRQFAEFSRERWLNERERTFWNPYVFAGLPATASLADPRPQYLPDVLLDAYEAPGRWPGWPPLLPTLLAHLAGMLATGLLARGLWGAGPWGFAWAGIAFGLATNVALPVTYGHDAQQVAVALLPVAALGTHTVFAAVSLRGGTLAGFALLSGALGLQALTGHPQYVAYTGMLVLAFAVERAWSFRRPARLLAVLAACALGAMISSAVWWPALLYAADSVRSGPWGGVGLHEVADYSLAPRDALSFVWPWAVGFGELTYWGGLRLCAWPPYLGVTVLALAAFGLVTGTRRGPAGFWFTVSLIGVVLAFGTHLGAVYVFLHEHFPLWSLFRVAVATLVVAHLGLALLSARGLERLLAGMRAGAATKGAGAQAGADARVRSDPRSPGARFRRRDMVVMLALVLVLIGIRLPPIAAPLEQTYAGFMRAARPLLDANVVSETAARAIADAAGTLVLLALAILAMAGARRLSGPRAWTVPAVGLFLLALLVWDLAPHDLAVARASSGSPRMLAPPPEPAVARLAAGDASTRVVHVDRPLFFSNDWVSWRARALGGLHGAAPLRWEELRGRDLFGGYAVMCAAAIGYITSDTTTYDDPDLFEPADTPGAWRVRHALPRAYSVPRVVVPGNDPAVLEAMAGPEFVPSRVAFSTDVAAAGEYPGASGMSGTWLADDPDRLVFEASAPDRTFLVIADAWFPGWRAHLDGEAVVIHRVNHMFRGVIVPAGTHKLTMVYEPASWPEARVLTLLAIGVWTLLALVALVLRASGPRD